MSRLYDEVERPLVRVLARMELVGVRVDSVELARLGRQLADEARALESQVHDLAGTQFLVNSVQQLREILYNKLGLTPGKKTKTGYSTDNQTLEKLRDEHPIIPAILRYREIEKLRSTYTDALLAEVGPDGRIHATFNQTVARTGRLSSDAPNLHNIPVRTEEGRQLRRVFVPAEGMRLLGGRLQPDRAAGDRPPGPGPRSDRSLPDRRRHPPDDGSPHFWRRTGGSDDRYALPGENGVLWAGLRDGGLRPGSAPGHRGGRGGRDTQGLFRQLPRVRAYMDEVVAEARHKGYTETLFGRRRLIPELSSERYQVRMAGERQAMNAGIQGLAADIFKVALVRLDARLDEEALRGRLVLQVHDEVILEVPPDEEEAAAEAVVAAMRGAAQLQRPSGSEPVLGTELGRRQGLSSLGVRTNAARAFFVLEGAWSPAPP